MPHVTFIHGIANKPAQGKLLDLWTRALSHDNGLDLGAEGVTTSMIYWADVYYENPLDDEPGYESSELSESLDLALKRQEPEPEVRLSETQSAGEAAWVATLAAKLNFAALVDE